MSPKTRRKEKEKRGEQRENMREANERLDLDPDDTENEGVTLGNAQNNTASTPLVQCTSSAPVIQSQNSPSAPYSNFDRRLTDLENRFDNKLATNLAETQARMENSIRMMGETIVKSIKTNSQKSSQHGVSIGPTVLGVNMESLQNHASTDVRNQNSNNINLANWNASPDFPNQGVINTQLRTENVNNRRITHSSYDRNISYPFIMYFYDLTLTPFP